MNLCESAKEEGPLLPIVGSSLSLRRTQPLLAPADLMYVCICLDFLIVFSSKYLQILKYICVELAPHFSLCPFLRSFPSQPALYLYA